MMRRGVAMRAGGLRVGGRRDGAGGSTGARSLARRGRGPGGGRYGRPPGGGWRMVPLFPPAQPCSASTKNTSLSAFWERGDCGVQVTPKSSLRTIAPTPPVEPAAYTNESPNETPASWSAAPAFSSFHWIESAGGAQVRGATPTAPTATARIWVARHTERRFWPPATAGWTTNQDRPRSWVPAITPLSPTAQPSRLLGNDTPRRA